MVCSALDVMWHVQEPHVFHTVVNLQITTASVKMFLKTRKDKAGGKKSISELACSIIKKLKLPT